MKQILFMFAIALAFGLCVTTGHAQQKGQDAGKKIGPVYNPAITYPGEYETNMILFKNSPKDTIWRRIPNLDRLWKVTCPDALAHLKQEGKWEGHLRLDGSCGSIAEPADWSMGNRRNYDEALEEQRAR